MLSWFEMHAPIRIKFRVLLLIHATLAGCGVLATILAGGGAATIALAAGALALTVVVCLVSAKLICEHYVSTVVRMEALAAGDTQSPIEFTGHRDCVGRMAKAMAIFRDNEIEIQSRRRGAQEMIVRELSAGLKSLSERDLDCAIVTPFPGDSDTLRRDFNAAVDALAETIASVSSASQSVSISASQIRAASDDLALRNEQQAASLEETAAAMNSVTSTMRETASGAAQVEKSISDAHHEAAAGGAIVSRATEAMAAIEGSAREIAEITNVIDGIAFQTNLLALNAGVEAARAGDAGKGFAVVANEVRALAQRSAEAAKDIKELIETSSRQVADGVGLVGETGSALNRIVGRISEITRLIKDIAESAASQSISLESVNGSVSEMGRMTQQNAAMVEQSTAAARSLATEADALSQLVGRFHLGKDAAGAAMRLVPRHAAAPRAVTRAAPVPRVSGNLALKEHAQSDEDWSEF